MGLHGQDTSELFFEGVKVPVENLLGGEEGHGMHQLMHDLPYERTVIAVGAVGAMEGGVEETLEVRARAQDFRPAGVELPEHALQAGRARKHHAHRAGVLGSLRRGLVAGKLDTETASMAKWWITDMQQQGAG